MKMDANAPLKARSKRAKLRRMGLLPPGLVDSAPAHAHAKRLHDHGMSMRQIGEASGTSMATVSELLGGYRSGRQHSGLIRRSVSDLILAVEWAPYTGDRGAMFPSLGLQRRIQALCSVGYSLMFMSTYMGYHKSSKSYVGGLLRNQYTHQSTWTKVNDMYLKLRYVDPVDMGIVAEQRDRSITRSARKNWAPPSAWDDDVIDNRDARPEWTGACGSMKGVRLHRAHNILPLCERCIAAQRVDLKSLKANYGKSGNE